MLTFSIVRYGMGPYSVKLGLDHPSLWDEDERYLTIDLFTSEQTPHTKSLDRLQIIWKRNKIPAIVDGLM